MLDAVEEARMNDENDRYKSVTFNFSITVSAVQFFLAVMFTIALVVWLNWAAPTNERKKQMIEEACTTGIIDISAGVIGIKQDAYSGTAENSFMKASIDRETLAKELHEAGRKAVEGGNTVAAEKFGEQTRKFLEWDEVSESVREGRRIQADYLIERYNIYSK